MNLTLLKRIFLTLLATVVLSGCINSTETENGTEPAAGAVYRNGTASRGGIGKFYLDREISETMGHQGARWLQRPEREGEERTDLLLENLPLETGDIVADIGAGTGYFSLPIAERIGAGKVYAVDIQPEMLERIGRRMEKFGISNIERVLATETDPGLPANFIDLVLLVDAYHEFAWPNEVMTALFNSLKPGGRIILIEYRAEDPEVNIIPLHKMTENQAKREMLAVGLEWLETRDFLPQQHFMVFQRPTDPVPSTNIKGTR
jgi:SAM-dependent methyltransferase